MAQQVFRKSSMDKINSPEQLNEYIKVSSPSVWIILAAVMVLLAAVLLWSATGSLPTQVSANGIAEKGTITCYLSQENAAKLQKGMTVNLTGGETGLVSSVGSIPLSKDEVDASVSGDYALHVLALGDWNIPVTVEIDAALQEGQVYPLTIITDSVNPIEFLLNGQGG